MIKGNLGQVPEKKESQGGKTFCVFSIAENTKDSEGNEYTYWHDFFAWGNLVDKICNPALKGRKLWVDYKIRYQGEGKEKKAIFTAKSVSVEL